MKVLHLTGTFLPWSMGGKEVYTHTLVKALEPLGVENRVVVQLDPTKEMEVGESAYDGTIVRVLPSLPQPVERSSLFSKRVGEIPCFPEYLDELKPDVVHFHDWGLGSGPPHLTAVKQRGIPVLLTYHSPGQTCPQTALLRNGRVPCDGRVTLTRCTACRLTAAGIPVPLSHLIGSIDFPFINGNSSSLIARTLSSRKMTRLFRDSLQYAVDEFDAIVVIADWSTQVWIENGTPRKKLHLIRTGGTAERNKTPHDRNKELLRLVYVGRCAQIKGIHVLIDAVKMLPKTYPLEVHFFSSEWDSEYGKQLLARIEKDERFKKPRTVPNDRLVSELSAMDLLIVPSSWLETGPLVVFDGFAAGLPVVGSRLGGLLELVKDGLDGLLVEPENPGKLASTIERLFIEPELLDYLRMNVKPGRTMQEAAQEYYTLYQSLVKSAVS